MIGNRLRQALIGYQQRRNDLLFFENPIKEEIVYYFGGDIQDWPDRMKVSRENRSYLSWNLLATGERLCQRFINASIVIVRANEMKDDTFSRFSNFVPRTTEYGDPITYETGDLLALRHLHALEENLLSSSSAQITLIGFSKGCVVLNQFLHELTYLRQGDKSHELLPFASRIRTFIWLDSGHNNGAQAMIWPTDPKLIETLTKFNIRTEIYVTPFQINSNNPYKRFHWKHYQIFCELLKSSSSSSSWKNEMFFADETPSIEKHFQLLNQF